MPQSKFKCSLLPSSIVKALSVVLLAGLAVTVPTHAQTADTAKAAHPSPALATSHMGIGEGATATLRVLVGRSLPVESTLPLRRVFVSDPNVLDSYTAGAREIVVTAKAPGISTLILWDISGQRQIYLVSSDIDVSELQTSIQKALPNELITVEAKENHVVLSGTIKTPEAMDTALKLAGAYSKDVENSLVVAQPRAKQVKLKVRIVEIDRSKLNQFGFNFFSPQGNNLSSTSTGQFPTTATFGGGGTGGSQGLNVSDPLNLFLYNQNLNIGVTIKDLEQKQVLQILAEPTITTMSGQKASFLSGGEFPFPVVQGGTGGFTSVTIQFRPFGVRLDFTPTVAPDGSIQLKVSPEVSALDYTNAVTISGYTIPALSTRRADTQVQVLDGQSFAISGLLDHRTTEMLSKVPGIGNVPILGELFRSKNISRSVIELVVIVTPSIVDPLAERQIPSEPKMAMPFLDNEKFDQTITPRANH